MSSTLDIQQQKRNVPAREHLEYATQSAIDCIYDEKNLHHEQETFPILVSYISDKKPIICTATEDFQQFGRDLKGFFGVPADGRLSLTVFWSSGNAWSQRVNPANLYPILRMMQARPGKDCLDVAVAP